MKKRKPSDLAAAALPPTNPLLGLVVFVCGGCVMTLELTGSRLMAPYLGASIYVWTSLIGVILGCLSFGYWLGGRWADRKPDDRILARILFFSGLSVAVIALAGDPVLIFVQSLVHDIRFGSVIATILLFGFPSVLLGMVAPYAVCLKLKDLSKTGSTAGNLYAISTLGSIAGTFLAGFVLLTHFSHRSVLFMISFTLIILSPLASRRSGKLAPSLSAMGVLLLTFTGSFVHMVMGEGFVEENTPYNRVWIYDGFKDEHPVRVMQLNDTGDSVIFLDSEDLVLDYLHYFRLAGHFNPTLTSALMIGGGAFSYPRHFLNEFSGATMDVVEIDHELTELSRRYFKLTDHPRLHIFHEDGRTFLNHTTNRYDVVYGDAYKSFSVPFQLATVEAFQKIYDCLQDDGIFIANIISAIEGEKGRVFRAMLATLEEVFPDVVIFAPQNMEDGTVVQNVITVAFKKQQALTFTDPQSNLNQYLSRRWTRDIPRDIPPMTDSFAPVERYAMPLIVNDPESRTGFLNKKLKAMF